MGVIFYIFNRLRFFFITEIRTGGYANSDGAMDGIAVWAAILLLGPTALWLKVIWNILIYFSSIYRERTTQSYWNRGRMFSADLSSDLLATLIALAVYKMVGGEIPISDYSIRSIVPAFLAIIVQYIGISSGLFRLYLLCDLVAKKCIAYTHPTCAIFLLDGSFFTCPGEPLWDPGSRYLCWGRSVGIPVYYHWACSW